MIDSFFDTDLEMVEPGTLSQVQRLPIAGTSGTVFKAIERQSGREVAVKVSYAEESSKGCLLAEAAALSSPLRVVAETGSQPTVREFYRRFDPFARVGLLMEWLDDSYTPVEKLVQDPSIKLTDLQVLRIIAPFTALLAAAHQHGFVYVDIGAQKADHLWWRMQRTATGRWQVPRDASGQPRFQLKVIDWANAINMDDPSYTGNVTPADDIAGTGELMFYMSHGAGVPLPTDPFDAVLAGQKGTLDDIIRRAMFRDAEGSFVTEVQRGLSPRERTDLLRDPERRAAATVELNKAVREMLDRLSSRYLSLVSKAREAVAVVSTAADKGLLALNQAIQQTLQKLYGNGQVEDLGDLNAQALKLSAVLSDMLVRAREIDPDRPEADVLEAELSKLEQLLAERRGLENVRRLLAQVDLSGLIDLKRVDDAIGRARRDGSDLVLVDDLALLEQIARTLEEAAQQGQIDPRPDREILPRLVECALDAHGVLDPPGAPVARQMVLGLNHWGSGPAMLALRLNIARRAGVEILRDQVQHMLDTARETAGEIEMAARSESLPKSMQLHAATSATRLHEAAAFVAGAFDQLKQADSTATNLPLGTVLGLYASLASAVEKLLGLEEAQLPFSHKQRTNLIETPRAIGAALSSAEARLNVGQIATAAEDLHTWVELDPQSSLAERYVALFNQRRTLDKDQVTAAIKNTQPSDLPMMLNSLGANLVALMQIAPQSVYLRELYTLSGVTMPLAELLATKQAVQPITSSQRIYQPQAASPGRSEFAVEVSRAIRQAFLSVITGAQASVLAASQVVQPSSAGGWSSIAAELVERYKTVESWQSGSHLNTTPDDARTRMQILAEQITAIERKYAVLQPVTGRFRDYARKALVVQAMETLHEGDLKTSAEWFAALGTKEGSAARSALQQLNQAWATASTSGPFEALNIANYEGLTRWLAEAGEFRDAIEPRVVYMRQELSRQCNVLESTREKLKSIVLERTASAAALKIEEALQDLLDETSPGQQHGLSADLKPLINLWAESMPERFPQLGVPLRVGLLSRLSGGLDSILTTLSASNAARRSTRASAVSDDTVTCVYKPLAGALRHVSKQLVVANQAGETAPAAVGGRVGTPYRGVAAHATQAAQEFSTPFYVGLAATAFGLSALLAALLIKGPDGLIAQSSKGFSVNIPILGFLVLGALLVFGGVIILVPRLGKEIALPANPVVVQYAVVGMALLVTAASIFAVLQVSKNGNGNTSAATPDISSGFGITDAIFGVATAIATQAKSSSVPTVPPSVKPDVPTPVISPSHPAIAISGSVGTTRIGAPNHGELYVTQPLELKGSSRKPLTATVVLITSDALSFAGFSLLRLQKEDPQSNGQLFVAQFNNDEKKVQILNARGEYPTENAKTQSNATMFYDQMYGPKPEMHKARESQGYIDGSITGIITMTLMLTPHPGEANDYSLEVITSWQAPQGTGLAQTEKSEKVRYEANGGFIPENLAMHFQAPKGKSIEIKIIKFQLDGKDIPFPNEDPSARKP